MKRIVEVSSLGSYLSLKQGNLVITQDRQEVGRVPIEDLGALILASQGLTITSAALAKLAELGAITVVAGSDHQPEAVMLPLRANTTRGERIAAQTSAKRPLEKQLWASLIRTKVLNQAALLHDLDGVRKLKRLATQVRSGDPDNLEAQAARAYWPLVFEQQADYLPPGPFRRGQAGTWPNNLLNYGYAILRAITARSLCGAGLLPEVGVHHHNRYDAFALASDVMEPYRPWVDHACRELLPSGPCELDRQTKRTLLGIYNDPVQLGDEQTPLFVAIERTAASLAGAFLASKSGCGAIEASAGLRLPSFLSSHEG